MKKLVLLAFIPFVCIAQESDPSRPQLSNLSQTGKLVTVKVVPKANTLTITLAEKEAVNVDLKTARIEVKVLGPRPRALRVSPVTHLEYQTEKIDMPSPYDVEIKTHVEDKTETFKFKVNNRLP